MKAINPFLWFDTEAEEAAEFYVSIFSKVGKKTSKITSVVRYGDAGPGPEGSVMVVEFKLNGQDFIALNGGPQYKFTEAISLFVNCETQKEVDYLWNKLSEGGEEVACGWLKDKYGLAWQIVPTVMMKYLKDKNPVKSQRAFETMLQMKKLDIKKLKEAYEQK